MDRLYQANAGPIRTPAPDPGSLGFVQSDVPLPSFIPTSPGPFFDYYVTESFLTVIEAAGLTPDAENLHQLADAIGILSSGNTPVAEEMLIRFRSTTEELQYLAQYQAYQDTHLTPVPVIAIGGTFDAANCSAKITLTEASKVARVTGSGAAAVLTTETWYGPADDKSSVVEFEILSGNTAAYYIGAHLVHTTGYPDFTPDADMTDDGATMGYRRDGTCFDTTGERGGPFVPLVSGDVVGILAYGQAYFFVNGVIIPGVPSLQAGPPFVKTIPMIARVPV